MKKRQQKNVISVSIFNRFGWREQLQPIENCIVVIAQIKTAVTKVELSQTTGFFNKETCKEIRPGLWMWKKGILVCFL